MVDSNWVKGLESEFGSAVLKVRDSAPHEPEIFVAAPKLHEILAHLKNLAGGAFDHLADMTAYDEKGSEPRFKVFYELISMERKQRCRVVVALTEAEAEAAVLPTVSDLWKGANWLERETFDMYGIRFSGHPDMRRILMPEVFEGYPLRKDFDLFYRQKFAEAKDDDATFDPFKPSILTPKEPS